nr:translation initiation factor IF-2-like [Aegilops tauschii subsp. strangulata]
MTPQPCARDAPSPAFARFPLAPCVSVHCGVAAAPHQPRHVRLRPRLAAESPCRTLSGSASRAGRVAAAASCAPAPLAGSASRARRLAATASRMSSPRRASQAARSPIPGRPPRDAVSTHSAAAVAGSHSPRADSRPHPSGVTAAGSARLSTVRRPARRFSFARRPPVLAGSRPHPGRPRAPLPRSGGAPAPLPATQA